MADRTDTNSHSPDGGSNALLQSVDSATLTPLVRRALCSETIEVTCWGTQQVHGGAGHGSAGGSTVHRVSGRCRDKGQAVEWSLILKVLHPPADPGPPSDWDYWRREACAYESGLLDDLPGGLAAPRCFGVVDQPDGGSWIWMEDVQEDVGEKWPLEHYGVVARHLGQFNAAYLTGQRTIPSSPWLRRRGWLRDYIARAGLGLQQLAEFGDHPLVRLVFPPDVADSLLRRWAKRAELLDALDLLPMTLCHGDAFRRNLLACRTSDGLERTVAVDWCTVGTGWIGMEIVMLIDSTLLFREVERSKAKELHSTTLAGYLEGLGDAGWRGNPRQVRLGITAERALNILCHVPNLIGVLTDEHHHAWVEQFFGVSVAQFAGLRAEDMRQTMQWEDEARELLDAL